MLPGSAGSRALGTGPPPHGAAKETFAHGPCVIQPRSLYVLPRRSFRRRSLEDCDRSAARRPVFRRVPADGKGTGNVGSGRRQGVSKVLVIAPSGYWAALTTPPSTLELFGQRLLVGDPGRGERQPRQRYWSPPRARKVDRRHVDRSSATTWPSPTIAVPSASTTCRTQVPGVVSGPSTAVTCGRRRSRRCLMGG